MIMKYPKQYQEFAKSITDKFIEILSEPYEFAFFRGDERGFYEYKSDMAMKWLHENMIPYDVWVKRRSCVHKLHNSGLDKYCEPTFDGEPNMFLYYPPNNPMSNGFWTTGKCVHCGEVMETEK